jgi:hypothetical protein
VVFKFFENFAERQFRKTVHRILVANVPDFSKLEGGMPHSTVETAYRNAWLEFGKPSHGERSSIYKAECAKAGEYILHFYELWIQMAAGEPKK